LGHEFKFVGFTADMFFTQKIRSLSGIGDEKSGFLSLEKLETETYPERGAPEGALALLSIRIRLAGQPWATKT
jgi:hypothetical protein